MIWLGAVAILSLLSGPLQATAVRAAPAFELRLAEYEPGPGLTEARLESGQKIYVGRLLATSDDVVRAQVKEEDGHFRIVLEFGMLTGIASFLATAGRTGHPVAIVVNHEVLAAPPITSGPLANVITIGGSFTQQEAEAIVQDLNKRRK
jgi:preprotein translocase subunit SecD